MRIPVKGDTISLRGCRGTSPRTIWKVVSSIDNQGFGRIKSIKSGKQKRVVLDEKKFFSLNPSFKPRKSAIKFHAL